MTKLGIRYYDPTLGRFTQPDPTGQDPHYTYARNNPILYIDPSGALSLGDVGAFVAGQFVGGTVAATCAAGVIGFTGGVGTAGAYFCGIAGAAAGSYIEGHL